MKTLLQCQSEINNYKFEPNSCTVAALAAVTGLSFPEALKIAKAAGRETKKGFYSSKLLAYAQEKHGMVFTACPIPSRKKNAYRAAHSKTSHFCSMSAKNLLAHLDPTKRYYVTSARHAFAIVNGEIFDTQVDPSKSARKIIKSCWEYQEPAKTEADLIARKAYKDDGHE